jgi:hypothetical protein
VRSYPDGASSLPCESDGERVVWRRAVRLIFAGWLPQEGVSAGSHPLV